MNPTATVDAVLRQQAKARADAPFVSCGTTSHTFAQMNEVADKIASGLAAHGLKPGDRVAVICPNRPEMLELYFGCARLGAIQVPLNVFLKGKFLAHQLADSGATFLITDQPGLRAATPLLPELPEITTIVTLDGEQPDARSRCVDYASVVSAGSNLAAIQVASVEPSDTMAVLYTSGTTGPAKGCVLSNGYYVRAGWMGAQMMGLGEDEHLVTSLPLFHGAASLLAVVGALISGARLSILPEFRASTFLAQAGEVHATVALGVGAMAMALLARRSSPADTHHSLQRAVWVALPPDSQVAFESRFGIRVQNGGFGQTECVPMTICRPDGYADRRALGVAAPDLEMAALDDECMPVGVGEIGEVAIRPRHRYAMFDGYWNNANATVASWNGLWHHTGDFGRIDSDGLLYFVDRKKDSLRRRGENVSSMELEAAISGHPKVAAAAVHAVPSEQSEDDIKACLVLVSGAQATPKELFSYFAEKLPYFAIPRYVEIVPELPVNAVGRVMKYQLRERAVTEATWDLPSMGLTIDRAARRGGESLSPNTSKD